MPPKLKQQRGGVYGLSGHIVEEGGFVVGDPEEGEDGIGRLLEAESDVRAGKRGGPGLARESNLNAACLICTGPAAVHQHYGAICCYSCRAFFRRGITRNYVCVRGDNMCQVTSITRTNCKRCRYNRCLNVGMKPELVDATLKRKQEEKRRQEMIDISQEMGIQTVITGPEVPRASVPSAQQVLQAVQEIQHPHSEITPHQAQTSPGSILGYDTEVIRQNASNFVSNTSTDNALLYQALGGRRKVLLELRSGAADPPKCESSQLSPTGSIVNVQEHNMTGSVSGLQLVQEVVTDQEHSQFTVQDHPNHPPRAHQPVRQQTYYIFHPASQTFEPITIAEFEENAVIEEVVIAEDYSISKSSEEDVIVAPEHDYIEQESHKSDNEVIKVIENKEVERKPVISPLFHQDRGAPHTIKVEKEVERVHTSVIKRTGRRREDHYSLDNNCNNIPNEVRTVNTMAALNTDLGRVIEETIGESLGMIDKPVEIIKKDDMVNEDEKGGVDIEKLVDVCFEEELGRTINEGKNCGSIVREEEIILERVEDEQSNNDIEMENVTNDLEMGNVTNDIEIENVIDLEIKNVESVNNIIDHDKEMSTVKVIQRNRRTSVKKRRQSGSPLPLKKRRKMHQYPIAMAINRQRVPNVSFTMEEEFRLHDLSARKEHVDMLMFENLMSLDENIILNDVLRIGNFFKSGQKMHISDHDFQFLLTSCRELYALKSNDIFEELNVLKKSVSYRCQYNAWPAGCAIDTALWLGCKHKGIEGQWKSMLGGDLIADSVSRNWPLIGNMLESFKGEKGIDLNDYEMFSSPWAQSIEDEEFFEQTTRKLGQELGGDLKLAALFHLLVMISPPSGARLTSNKKVQRLQADLGQLLYRYLASSSTEGAAEKAYSLIGYLDKIHRCGDIMFNKRIRMID